MDLLIFSLDQQLLALPLSNVERVIQATEVTALPNSLPHLLGLIKMGDQILTVVDLRYQLRLPSKELGLEDQFIICNVDKKGFALWVDFALGIQSFDNESFVSPDQLPDLSEKLEGVQSIIKKEEAIILVYALETLIRPHGKKAEAN